jgi:hypothetical protein
VASVVNLNRFRKDKARAEKAQRAAENRALHGRSKADRQAGTVERRRADRDLDSKKLDDSR